MSVNVCVYTIYILHTHIHIYLNAEYRYISKQLALIQFTSSSCFFLIPVVMFENMTAFFHFPFLHLFGVFVTLQTFCVS